MRTTISHANIHCLLRVWDGLFTECRVATDFYIFNQPSLLYLRFSDIWSRVRRGGCFYDRTIQWLRRRGYTVRSGLLLPFFRLHVDWSEGLSGRYTNKMKSDKFICCYSTNIYRTREYSGLVSFASMSQSFNIFPQRECVFCIVLYFWIKWCAHILFSIFIAFQPVVSDFTIMDCSDLSISS